MLAETVADTDGRTLQILKYKIRPSVAYSYSVIAADTLRDLVTVTL